ncbi:MAG: FAD:protein FMN transferase [Acidimicrobiales bacterium]
MAAAEVPVVVEHRFRVMGSDGHVIVVGPPEQATRLAEHTAPRRLAGLEAHWSRFVPASDLCRLAAAEGDWCRVHPDTIALVETMQAGSIATVGRYDPTLAVHLAAAGHPSSAALPDRPRHLLAHHAGRSSIHDIEVDRRSGLVRTPAGLALDPGGIGKGLAADLVAAELCAAGAAGALVGVGGDLAARGTPPDENGWMIVVEHPDEPGTVLGRIAIDGGGVATSSTRSSRWVVDGSEAHHVIDPDSGSPSTTDLAAVTVIAPTGWQAEVHATAALLEGSEGAVRHMEAWELDGVAVALDGTRFATTALAHLGSAS